jgi:hypothetical protein
MIIGLATRDQSVPLETRKVAEGLYVVLNAYKGRYTFFECEESKTPIIPNEIERSNRKLEESERGSKNHRLHK